MPLEERDYQIARKVFHEVGAHSTSGVPFLIARTICGVTIKGEMIDPREHETYRFWGEWVPERPPRTGHYFRFEGFEILVSRETGGMEDYLVRYVPGLGRVRAAQLVERHGTDVLDVLRKEPERAGEIPGVGPQVVERIRQHFEAHPQTGTAYADVYSLLSQCEPPVSRRTMLTILQDFGSNAVQVLRENPYLLLSYPRMGWDTVDGFAVKKVGYDRQGLARFKGAVVEALTRVANDQGDTYATETDLILGVGALCGARPPAEAIDALIENEVVVRDQLPSGETVYALAHLDAAERYIAHRLRELADAALPLTVAVDTEGLEGEQVDAAHVLESEGVSILSGGAGCGKSYTFTKLLSSVLPQTPLRTMIGAPTGKAAKRASELMDRAMPEHGIEIGTLHRLLGLTPASAPVGVPQEHAKFGRGREEFTFAHGETDPLPVDLINGDEVSMVDVMLMSSLLEATPLGARMILAGDPNQLPSVGPGAVLRDLIAGGLPTAMLTKPRRNAGKIVEACHALKDGRCPRPAPDYRPETGDNWLHIEERDPAAIAQIIVELHRQTVRDPLWDLQVISPQNARLPVGCANLNRLLSAALNPQATQREGGAAEDDEGGPRYRPGDKVVRTKNGVVDLLLPVNDAGDEEFAFDRGAGIFTWKGRSYSVEKTPVVNGDIGQVLGRTEDGRHHYVIVRFRNPDRLCCLPASEDYLSLAYAITTHKAQGSGFPYVILPVHESFQWNRKTQTGLWSREMLYTMFSRAEDVLVTVGTLSSIELAAKRKTLHKRRTRLAEFVRRAFAPREVVQGAIR